MPNFYTRWVLEAHNEWPPNRARSAEGHGPPTAAPAPGRPYYFDVSVPGLETVYVFDGTWHPIATIGGIGAPEDPR